MSARKLLNTSFFYLILGLAGGVFFREFTKWNDFTGKTMLGGLHVHTLMLGMFFFLILSFFAYQNQDFFVDKAFRRFYWIYNISLLGTITLMLIRGITQVLAITLSSALSPSISGVAGLFHIGLAVAFFLFFRYLQKRFPKEKA